MRRHQGEIDGLGPRYSWRALLGVFGVTLTLLALQAAPEVPYGEETNSHLDYTEAIPGSQIAFDMVAVPGGAFRLGSPETEKGRGADEGPQRWVRIRPFWMGKREVTWDEFDVYRDHWSPNDRENETALAKNADAVTRPTQPYIDETHGFGREGYPVIGLSHHTAMEYCHWLSKVTGKAYRLPTEAEWEYACRAGSAGAFFFGDDDDQLERYAWYTKNSDETTHPVGQKKPNRWGLYDMYGNVTEWCLDHYQSDVYSGYPPDRPLLAPVLLPTEKRYPHVVRGGSWKDPWTRCRSAARRASDKSWNKADPDRPQSIWWLANGGFVGFRVVRAVEEQKELRGLRSKVTKKSP